MELLLGLADVIDENAEELARLESLNVGKPWWVAKDEPPLIADNLRFFAGAARNLEGKSAAEYVEGYTSMIRREPLGVVAGITPWNYPLFMVGWKMGPGARRRKRADHQAGRADAAHHPPLRRARAGRAAARRAPGRHRRRCSGRRRARPSPGDLARLAHRRRLHGQADREERGRHRQARAPRARRQGADGRARRRRPGHRGRGDQDRRLLQLGPGLHRVRPHPRQRARLRRRPRRDREGGGVADSRATRPRTTRSGWGP